MRLIKGVECRIILWTLSIRANNWVLMNKERYCRKLDGSERIFCHLQTKHFAVFEAFHCNIICILRHLASFLGIGLVFSKRSVSFGAEFSRYCFRMKEVRLQTEFAWSRSAEVHSDWSVQCTVSEFSKWIVHLNAFLRMRENLLSQRIYKRWLRRMIRRKVPDGRQTDVERERSTRPLALGMLCGKNCRSTRHTFYKHIYVCGSRSSDCIIACTYSDVFQALGRRPVQSKRCYIIMYECLSIESDVDKWTESSVSLIACVTDVGYNGMLSSHETLFIFIGIACEVLLAVIDDDANEVACRFI